MMKSATWINAVFLALALECFNAPAASAGSVADWQPFGVPDTAGSPYPFRRFYITTYTSNQPNPAQPGRDNPWGQRNRDGWNINYVTYDYIGYTNGPGRVDSSNPILHTDTDWPSYRVAELNAALALQSAAHNLYSIVAYQTAPPTIKYNCVSHVAGRTSVWIEMSGYFHSVGFFSSGNPQWIPVVGTQSPQIAGFHPDSVFGWFYDHVSKVAESQAQAQYWDEEEEEWVTYTYTYWKYTGKFGMHGVYATTVEYPERFYGAWNDYEWLRYN